MQTVRFKVMGRVQGVGFRYYTCREGRRRGLAGWVRNETDGSVLVHVQGDEPDVDAMRRWLSKGPPSARVDSLREMPAVLDDNLFDFEITY